MVSSLVHPAPQSGKANSAGLSNYSTGRQRVSLRLEGASSSTGSPASSPSSSNYSPKVVHDKPQWGKHFSRQTQHDRSSGLRSSSDSSTASSGAALRKLPDWMQNTGDSPFFMEIIPKQLYFTAHANEEETLSEIRSHRNLFFVSTNLQERNDDIGTGGGPVDLADIVRFRDFVREHKRKVPSGRPLVYYCTDDYSSKANTALLLASYLMLEQGLPADQAVRPFLSATDTDNITFTDSLGSSEGFELTLRECLHALEAALRHEWFSAASFKPEALELAVNSAGHVMSELCPGLLLQLSPPHSPDSMAESVQRHLLAQCSERGVSAVICLSHPGLDAMQAPGVQVHSIAVKHPDAPSQQAVSDFLEAASVPAGCSAVVLSPAGACHAATMAALWLIHRYRVTAATAAAWLCLCRPGISVGGDRRVLNGWERRLLGSDTVSEREAIPLPITADGPSTPPPSILKSVRKASSGAAGGSPAEGAEGGMPRIPSLRDSKRDSKRLSLTFQL